MNDLTQIKLGFGLLFLAIILSFGLLLKKTDSLDNSQNDLQQNFVKPNDGISSIVAEKPNSLTVKLTPTPFIKQKGKVKGEISVVKFEKDLETSLKIQETPKIWLEFTDDENRAVKAELPKKAKEYVRQKWLSFFELSYQMRSAKNREDEIEIETKNLTNTDFRCVMCDL